MTMVSNISKIRSGIVLVGLIAGLSLFQSAGWSADFQTGLDAYAKRDFATAVREWTPLAEEGDANAQSHLGVLYALGQGVERDYAVAVKWFRAAAEKQHAPGEFNLGLLYARGQGLEIDKNEAARLFASAAAKSHARAQFELGLMYRSGNGVEKDYKKAADLFRQSAEQGFAVAGVNLAVAYAKGQGVKQDYITAYMWADLAGARRYQDALKRNLTPEQLAEAKKRAAEIRTKNKASAEKAPASK